MSHLDISGTGIDYIPMVDPQEIRDRIAQINQELEATQRPRLYELARTANQFTPQSAQAQQIGDVRGQMRVLRGKMERNEKIRADLVGFSEKFLEYLEWETAFIRSRLCALIRGAQVVPMDQNLARELVAEYKLRYDSLPQLDNTRGGEMIRIEDKARELGLKVILPHWDIWTQQRGDMIMPHLTYEQLKDLIEAPHMLENQITRPEAIAGVLRKQHGIAMGLGRREIEVRSREFHQVQIMRELNGLQSSTTRLYTLEDVVAVGMPQFGTPIRPSGLFATEFQSAGPSGSNRPGPSTSSGSGLGASSLGGPSAMGEAEGSSSAAAGKTRVMYGEQYVGYLGAYQEFQLPKVSAPRRTSPVPLLKFTAGEDESSYTATASSSQQHSGSITIESDEDEESDENMEDDDETAEEEL